MIPDPLWLFHITKHLLIICRVDSGKYRRCASRIRQDREDFCADFASIVIENTGRVTYFSA